MITSTDSFYRRVVAAFSAASPHGVGAWPKQMQFGRWRVQKLDNGIGRKISFIFNKEDQRAYTLMDTVVAINGIDGEVCEIRWHPVDKPPTDEEIIELMMLVP